MITRKQFGHIVFNAALSKVNGQIDDGSPREFEGRGWISDKCMKRKIRDQIEDHRNPLAQELFKAAGINEADQDQFHICESRKRGWYDIPDLEAQQKLMAMIKDSRDSVQKRFWDSRSMGNGILEGEAKSKDNGNGKAKKTAPKGTKVRKTDRGPFQMTPAISVRDINIIVDGISKKAPYRPELLSEENPTGDLAQGAIQIVEHAVYYCSYVINPNQAVNTGATDLDIDLLKILIPGIFAFDASADRANVHVVQAIHASHASLRPSCRELDFMSACRPIVKHEFANPAYPSRSLDEYHIPTVDEVREAMKNQDVEIEDLMA